MKRILVAFACAAGMLLVLSSSCSDNEGVTSAGGGSKGASGLPRLPFTWACPSGGGTGDLDAYVYSYENCSTGNTYVSAACLQVSGGFAVISFNRDSRRDISFQFIVPTPLAVGEYDINAGEAVFRARATGRRLEVFDSELCPRCTSTLEIDAINQATSGVWAAGDTIDINWNAVAGEVKDGACERALLTTDSGGNGGFNGIPYK